MSTEILTHIRMIGDEVVSCRNRCEGIYLQPMEGVIPRGLVFEQRPGPGSGAIILGMNPGQGDKAERDAYIVDPTYASTETFIREQRLSKNSYYRRLRTLLDQSGLSGDVVWTELAKCQNAPDLSGSLPDETYRICASKFLRREVGVTPTTWPILAIGRDAYRAATFLFLDRAVLGLPHPTGSRGYWHGLFSNGVLKTEVRDTIRALIDHKHAAWVPERVLTDEDAAEDAG